MRRREKRERMEEIQAEKEIERGKRDRECGQAGGGRASYLLVSGSVVFIYVFSQAFTFDARDVQS